MSLWILCATAGACGLGLAATAPPTPAAECVRRAYPEHVCDVRAGYVLWCDGSMMPWGDALEGEPLAVRLERTSIAGMMSIPYPVGEQGAPAVDEDPGRIRHDPFFAKMYGGSREAVASTTRRVRWMPESGGKVLRVTTVNGVDAALERVSERLEALGPELRAVAKQTSGGFVWRAIKGTDRRSAHSWGIAVDVAVPHSHYWKWTRPQADGTYPYRNTMPRAIVDAFEAEGFIWGGRWYHYDTMHFEYRPELLCAP